MKINDIPYNYAHCYATSEQCSQSHHCLRGHAARMNEELAMPTESLLCITPRYVAQVAEGRTCTHFRSDVLLRYARGMKKLFDLVPKVKYAAVRAQVMNCFSCERVFYYAQKGDQIISPKEQLRIASVFKRAGLPEPSFDQYELYPDWSE